MLCCIPVGIIPFPVQVVRVLRVLRVFRVFRMVSMFREMRIIIEDIGRAIPGVAWTGLLLIIVYYVFAVIGIIVDVVDQAHENADEEDLENQEKLEGISPEEDLLAQIALFREQVERVEALATSVRLEAPEEAPKD